MFDSKTDEELRTYIVQLTKKRMELEETLTSVKRKPTESDAEYKERAKKCIESRAKTRLKSLGFLQEPKTKAKAKSEPKIKSKANKKRKSVEVDEDVDDDDEEVDDKGNELLEDVNYDISQLTSDNMQYKTKYGEQWKVVRESALRHC